MIHCNKILITHWLKTSFHILINGYRVDVHQKSKSKFEWIHSLNTFFNETNKILINHGYLSEVAFSTASHYPQLFPCKQWEHNWCWYSVAIRIWKRCGALTSHFFIWFGHQLKTDFTPPPHISYFPPKSLQSHIIWNSVLKISGKVRKWHLGHGCLEDASKSRS